MSNQKNNVSKEKRSKEKKCLENKKMLLQMQKEIEKLEYDIKFANAKIYALRGLKIALRTGQLIAPFVVTAGIVLGGFTALGATI